MHNQTVRYSGKCYSENKHWHLSMRGDWSYHNGANCDDCKTADRKYDIQQPYTPHSGFGNTTNLFD